MPKPATPGQAVTRRKRALRRIEHWHLQALRGLLDLERDAVSRLLLDQIRIRLQLLATVETASPVPGSPIHAP